MSTTPDARPALGYFPSVPWIPFYVDSQAWPVRQVRCVSSTVAALADAGRLDVTPMATVDWLARRAGWPRLANFGLAYRQCAGSVLFFSQRPIETLDGADIAISDETTTSVRVLRALLAGKYGLGMGTWRRGVPADDATTPRLLIQDQAIVEAARGRFRHVYDIGHEWWQWQGTPIVSAVWVQRTGLDGKVADAMREALAASLDRYARDPAQAIRDHSARHGGVASTAALRQVLGNFEFALGPQAELGIARMAAVLPPSVPLSD